MPFSSCCVRHRPARERALTSLEGMTLSAKIIPVEPFDLTVFGATSDLARRKLQITGTSEFPNLAEPLPPQPSADAAATQSAAAPLAPSKPVEQGRAAAVATLPSCRDAEPFEALRDRADRALARNGTRPTVFLARLGPLADHAARSTWMTNLLAVGGIETCTQSDGFTASGAAGAAFAQSGATIAVITGSDASYAEIGEATAQALKSAGAKRVVLAGRPGGDEAQLRSAGVNAFVFAGQDVVAFLDNLLGALDA